MTIKAPDFPPINRDTSGSIPCLIPEYEFSCLQLMFFLMKSSYGGIATRIDTHANVEYVDTDTPKWTNEITLTTPAPFFRKSTGLYQGARCGWTYSRAWHGKYGSGER